MPYNVHHFRHVRFTIGQNIRHSRTQKRRTLQKLSTVSGVAPTLIDRYEIGKDEIRLEHLLRIACALETEIDELVRS